MIAGWIQPRCRLAGQSGYQVEPDRRAGPGSKGFFENGVLEISPPIAPPADPVTIDCENSGTTARLLTGLLAGWLPPGGPPVVLQAMFPCHAAP